MNRRQRAEARHYLDSKPKGLSVGGLTAALLGADWLGLTPSEADEIAAGFRAWQERRDAHFLARLFAAQSRRIEVDYGREYQEGQT